MIIEKDYNKLTKDKMNAIIREAVKDLTIMRHKAGRYLMYFGHESIEGGYAAYVRSYIKKPSLELANEHMAQLDSRYVFTQNEWDANEGHINE